MPASTPLSQSPVSEVVVCCVPPGAFAFSQRTVSPRLIVIFACVKAKSVMATFCCAAFARSASRERPIAPDARPRMSRNAPLNDNRKGCIAGPPGVLGVAEYTPVAELRDSCGWGAKFCVDTQPVDLILE